MFSLARCVQSFTHASRRFYEIRVNNNKFKLEIEEIIQIAIKEGRLRSIPQDQTERLFSDLIWNNNPHIRSLFKTRLSAHLENAMIKGQIEECSREQTRELFCEIIAQRMKSDGINECIGFFVLLIRAMIILSVAYFILTLEMKIYSK
jgi:hypothetical protein